MKIIPSGGFSTPAQVAAARAEWLKARAEYVADPSQAKAAAVRAALRLVESAEIRLPSFASRLTR